MRKKDFYFDLPEELIAQDPLEDRSSSRLLVLDKETGRVEHHVFREIIDYLQEGDCLVINDTKVIPARLIGSKIGTDAKIEVLLLKRKENDVWETLVKPGKKAKVGTRISFGDGLLVGEVVDIVEEGNRLIHFEYEGIFEEILDQLGQMPLPPYITHQLEDKNRYQTVYAKHSGSAAAPTAGLHFTPELLKEIEEKGVQIARVTLHVGLGTFRPVKVDNILEHHMHSEFYQIEEEAAEKINRAKESGHRVICVGTTSCRTIESAADKNGKLHPHHTSSNGYRYYSHEQLNQVMNIKPNLDRIVIGYCRVSSNKQKDDLERQIENMKLYLTAQGKPFEIISDIGSGINYKKKGLRELIKRISQNKVEKVVVLYKDRLLRFGFELIEYMASLYNCDIEIIDNTEKSEQQELVEDLVQIITVFSCKLQGKRANKARKLVKELIEEGGEENDKNNPSDVSS